MSDYINICFVSILMAMMNSIFTEIARYLMDFLKKVDIKTGNEAIIQYVTSSLLNCTDPEINYNCELINSILMEISHKPATRISCALSPASHKYESNSLEWHKSKIILSKPVTNVVYGDFVINYTKSKINPNKFTDTEHTLIITSKLSCLEITKFMKRCHDKYIEKMLTKKSYLAFYRPQEDLKYTKYPLNSKITFNDIWFSGKSSLIRLLNKLQDKKIRRASLLLHGIPGCGKTSIIKAAANYLGYHIIEVKLSYLKHDSQMNDIFHADGYKMIDGKLDTVPINRRIYVFEDIDAECNEVHVRQDNNKKKSGKITLSGILNTLDGILEIQDSLIIMTTNHPERIDPALIRYGRITMKMELGKMSQKNSTKLISRYFPNHKIKLSNEIVPATLEAFCQMAVSESELLQLINRG